MQNLDAVAFLVLGVAAAAIWLRERDQSTAYLALAIVLLSLVVALGRVTAFTKVGAPTVQFVSLVGFMGSGYALLMYRASLIPLGSRWRIGAASLVVAFTVAVEAANLLHAPTPL